METLSINYFAVFLGALLSMGIGAVWYGPLFGKKWMELIGANTASQEEIKKMQKNSGFLYLVQFVLTLFQILVLAYFVGNYAYLGGLLRAIWIWAAFVNPTLAGAIMWTNNKQKLQQFLIQGGYQLLMFIVFGLLLQFWK